MQTGLPCNRAARDSDALGSAHVLQDACLRPGGLASIVCLWPDGLPSIVCLQPGGLAFIVCLHPGGLVFPVKYVAST